MIVSDQAMQAPIESLGLKDFRAGFGDLEKITSKKVGSLPSAKQKLGKPRIRDLVK